MNWFSKVFNSIGRSFKDKFYPYFLFGTSPVFNDYTDDSAKILVAISNPALLKVISLQCELFSLGKFYVYNEKGEIRARDPLLKKLKRPNPMQSTQDWLWCYMFWRMLGNAHLYMYSKIPENMDAPWYWLEPHKIEWPYEIEKEKDKLILSKAKLERLRKLPLKYRYDDGTKMDFILGDLINLADLTNGTGNWFKGFSRLESLRKPLTNSEASLDSKNINVRYAGKFIVAGKQDPNDVTKKPMSEDEKLTLEERIDSDKKKVHGMKSMIDIKRFVDDLKAMELDKAYLADYYLIGNAYNIPRDVLEAYNSSTFENQEKARAGHVTYTLEPAGDQLGAAIADAIGYSEKNWTICLGWDHLPFTQVFARDKANMQQAQVNTMIRMLDAGMKIEDINAYLDTDFKLDEDAEARREERADQKTRRTKSKGYGKRPFAESHPGQD